MRRDRGADRARAPDPADGQPRADRLHRPEAALAADARAGGVRADQACAAAEGLRPLPAHRRARDRRLRRVGDAAVRRRQPALERRRAGHTRATARVAAARLRVDRDRGRRRPGRGRARRRDRRARPAVRRARHLRCRLRGARRVPAGAGGAAAHVLPRRARHLARDGRDALGGRGAAMAAARSRRCALRRADRRSGSVASRHRGSAFPALPPGRAHTACRPRGARRIRRPAAAPRPRRARPCRPRGRRLRPPRLARTASQRRRRGGGRPRLGRRRAERALADDRRLGPRPPARADRGRGGRRLRRGASRRRQRGSLRRTRTRPLRRPFACATGSSPTPTGTPPTRTATPATGACIRAWPCSSRRRDSAARRRC